MLVKSSYRYLYSPLPLLPMVGYIYLQSCLLILGAVALVVVGGVVEKIVTIFVRAESNRSDILGI